MDLFAAIYKTLRSLVRLHLHDGTTWCFPELERLKVVIHNNTALQHMHFTGCLPSYADGVELHPALEYLWSLRYRAISLSVNNIDFMDRLARFLGRHGPENFNVGLAQVSRICHHFRNLQQLGWNMPIPRTEWEATSLVVHILKAICVELNS